MIGERNFYCGGFYENDEDALSQGMGNTYDFRMPVEFLDDTSLHFPLQKQHYFLQLNDTNHSFLGSIAFKDAKIILFLSFISNDRSNSLLTGDKTSWPEVPVHCDVAEVVTNFCHWTYDTSCCQTLCYSFEFMGGAQNVVFRPLIERVVPSDGANSGAEGDVTEKIMSQWVCSVEKFIGKKMEICVFGGENSDDSSEYMNYCFSTVPWERLQKDAARTFFAVGKQNYNRELLASCASLIHNGHFLQEGIFLAGSAMATFPSAVFAKPALPGFAKSAFSFYGHGNLPLSSEECEQEIKDEVAQLLAEEERLARVKLGIPKAGDQKPAIDS